MANRTIGYHVVKSTYGMWLPGDERGSWSESWDEALGYIEPHTLHESDPVRLRMAQERMKHPPVRLSGAMIEVISEVLDEASRDSPWSIAAASIEATHVHLLITNSSKDIHQTTKWIAQKTTKAIHTRMLHKGPVWSKGQWTEYLFETVHWNNLVAYIERHNIRRGVGARPYRFLRSD
ncbi:MAG TPA: transposase [Phycisphaerales bacterium]|nr:transposase [Phycisphaerales bacterium]